MQKPYRQILTNIDATALLCSLNIMCLSQGNWRSNRRFILAKAAEHNKKV